MMYWKNISNRLNRAKVSESPTSTGSRERALEFYESFVVRDIPFPLFWSLFGYQRDSFVAIFEFFSRLELLLLNIVQTRPDLTALLLRRLTARCEGQPLPMPVKLDDMIQSASANQVAEFRILDSNGLASAAFELFVSGSLNESRGQYLRDEREPTNPNMIQLRSTDPEPDSAFFFLWAEFAFLAAAQECDAAYWIQTLPILLRAEKIYLRCYGQPDSTRPRAPRKFNDYDARHFSRVHPNETSLIPYPSFRRFDELEAEATRIAMSAFPGGFD